MSQKSIYIIFICNEHYISYITPIIQQLNVKTEIISPEQISEKKDLIYSANLLITIHSFVKTVLELFLELKGKIPTLTIQDGILEYKSSKHRFQGFYRYRPLVSDHIAVFGEVSQKLLLSYGVANEQIHITGSPRFDIIEQYKQKNHHLPYLLITMANRPGYGLKNIQSYYSLMEKLLIWLESQQVPFKLRLSRGVSNIGQESIYKVLENPSNILIKYFDQTPTKTYLYEDLANAFAVVTTPSTVSLEAMLFDIPVVHLLPDPTLVYLQTAWSICKEENIEEVIIDLTNIDPLKMSFQNIILNDNISHRNSSIEKITKLIYALLKS